MLIKRVQCTASYFPHTVCLHTINRKSHVIIRHHIPCVSPCCCDVKQTFVCLPRICGICCCKSTCIVDKLGERYIIWFYACQVIVGTGLVCPNTHLPSISISFRLNRSDIKQLRVALCLCSQCYLWLGVLDLEIVRVGARCYCPSSDSTLRLWWIFNLYPVFDYCYVFVFEAVSSDRLVFWSEVILDSLRCWRRSQYFFWATNFNIDSLWCSHTSFCLSPETSIVSLRKQFQVEIFVHWIHLIPIFHVSRSTDSVSSSKFQT